VSARQREAGDAKQRLVDCIEEIAQWMASNRLKLNAAKTDFMCGVRLIGVSIT